jgi:hypothetical protein
MLSMWHFLFGGWHRLRGPGVNGGLDSLVLLFTACLVASWGVIETE